MTTRVYLGHLSRDASDRDVETLFKSYGRIREVTLKNGFGFVEFADLKDAEDAVGDFHGKEFMGERLVVELARGDRRREERRDDDRRFGPPERTDFRLIVENLAHGVSWQDIKDLMRKAGEVTFADLSKDRDDEGVVEFSSEKDVQNALKSLDGENLRGKPISLRLFDAARDNIPRDMGGRGRDRFDGGGGGGDRHRDRRDRDRYDGREDRDRRDRGDRGRDHDRRNGRSHSRERERERRRSRSRDRGGRSDRDRDREREKEREKDRGRASAGDRDRARRPSRSPPRSKSPVVRRGRSRSGSRD